MYRHEIFISYYYLLKISFVQKWSNVQEYLWNLPQAKKSYLRIWNTIAFTRTGGGRLVTRRIDLSACGGPTSTATGRSKKENPPPRRGGRTGPGGGGGGSAKCGTWRPGWRTDVKTRRKNSRRRRTRRRTGPGWTSECPFGKQPFGVPTFGSRQTRPASENTDTRPRRTRDRLAECVYDERVRVGTSVLVRRCLLAVMPIRKHYRIVTQW